MKKPPLDIESPIEVDDDAVKGCEARRDEVSSKLLISFFSIVFPTGSWGYIDFSDGARYMKQLHSLSFNFNFAAKVLQPNSFLYKKQTRPPSFSEF